jgi:hypothetical protein
MVCGVSRFLMTDIFLPDLGVLLFRILKVLVPRHKSNDVAKGRVANEIQHDPHSRKSVDVEKLRGTSDTISSTKPWHRMLKFDTHM